MAEPKTRPTEVDVKAWLGRLPDGKRRDSEALATLMQQVAGEPPVLWGTSIVGFGRCLLPYADGSTQDWPLVAFSPRAQELVVYLMDGTAQHAGALARLGPHRSGKSCLYLKSLDRIDTVVLAQIIGASAQAMRAQHPLLGAGAQAKQRATKSATRKSAPTATKTAARKSTTPTKARSATTPGARSTAAPEAAGRTRKGAAAKPALRTAARSGATSASSSAPTSTAKPAPRRAPAGRAPEASRASARKIAAAARSTARKAGPRVRTGGRR